MAEAVVPPIDDEVSWVPTDTLPGYIHRVSELLPAGYDAYVRIFHPFVQWETEGTATDSTKTRSWRSLAAEARVTYHAELTWDALRTVVQRPDRDRVWSVAEGQMDEPLRSALFGLLAAESRGEAAYFYFRLPRLVRGLEPLLIRAPVGSIDDVRRVEGGHAGPDHVWPASREWLLCTDYDLTSSYVACGTRLAQQLLAAPAIEALPVSLDARVDHGADVLNGKGWGASEGDGGHHRID